MKGAFSLIGLIFTVVLIIVYVAFLPALTSIINGALPSVDSNTGSVLSLFPLFILLMIIANLWTQSSSEGGGP